MTPLRAGNLARQSGPGRDKKISSGALWFATIALKELYSVSLRNPLGEDALMKLNQNFLPGHPTFRDTWRDGYVSEVFMGGALALFIHHVLY